MVFMLSAVSPAFACTVSPTLATNFGSYSPAAVKAGAVPALPSRAGLTCPTSVLVLLGGNYIRAKFNSQNGMMLLRAGGGTVSYTASADPGATVKFSQDGTIDYMQNNLLNLLGLLGGSSADLPFYTKPASGALIAAGTYTDKITITWNWYICQGVGALSLCVGDPVQGSGQSIIDVTLTVTPKAILVATSSRTTWDPVNGTTAPKAVPLSRRRSILSVQNPDIVPLDSGSLMLSMPIPLSQTIALDGDGTGSSSFVSLTEGSPASGLALTYTAPESTSDDVDFSNDGGLTWSYSPIAGSSTSAAEVNAVRLRPRGAMAAGSTFEISVPVIVK
jgi:spore coat protein U-like protein